MVKYQNMSKNKQFFLIIGITLFLSFIAGTLVAKIQYNVKIDFTSILVAFLIGLVLLLPVVFIGKFIGFFLAGKIRRKE